MSEEIQLLSWIQNWFHFHCDGDWEHDLGITIRTLDNPGWAVSINLEGTFMEDRLFPFVKTERTEDDWVHSIVKDNTFNAYCGPHNLIEALLIFKEWVDRNSPKHYTGKRGK